MTGAVERLRELLAKATPGEWVFEFKSDHTVIRSMEHCDRPGAGYVCHINKNNVSKAEREANESLIAEAKDSLPALLDCVEAMPDLLKDYASGLTVAGFSEADIERLPTVRRIRKALSALGGKDGGANV